MICKECGAYNPDHATYCKVCAAKLTPDIKDQTSEVPAEDSQPTKRFSRPSWVVPEQTAKEEIPAKEIEPEEEQTFEEEQENDAPVVSEPEVEEETAEEPASEESVEEEPAEEEETLWMPTPVKRTRKAEPEAVAEDETENIDTDDIYNDEETLDQEDDSFEYEPTPPKRKSAKKKSNTLFTVLLIAIIVVIVCILVAGGLFLLSTNGVLKCTNSSLSSLMNCSGAQKTTNVTDPSADPNETNAPEATPANNPIDMPNETEATLEETTDENGSGIIRITVLVPAKATLTIKLPNPRMEDYVRTNSEDMAKLFAVRIDETAFYSEEPLDTPTHIYTPEISIETADGQTYSVNCPSFTREFKMLSITLTSPLANEDGTIMAAEGNVVHFEGKVNDDRGVKLTINGNETSVYADGIFVYDYTMTGSEAETITLVASKSDYVTATSEIRVEPYVFTPDPMVLEVNGDITSLRADKSGKLTITGKTLPGATLTAVSDNSTSVFCGTVNVDSEGSFSMQITMDPAFYGISKITMNASKEDAEDGTLTFVVSRSYKDKDEFVKAYNKAKSYKEVNNTITVAELLANQPVYATNNYGFRVSASVAEVMTVDGEQIVKMNILKTNETIYVHNMSSKWTPGDNVGKKYNVYGNFIGEYQDTGCIEFLGWFAKGIK